jgi:hypothetical protein
MKKTNTKRKLKIYGAGWGLNSPCSGQDPLANSGSINYGEFLEHVGDYQFLKKDTVPWNYILKHRRCWNVFFLPIIDSRTARCRQLVEIYGQDYLLLCRRCRCNYPPHTVTSGITISPSGAKDHHEEIILTSYWMSLQAAVPLERTFCMYHKCQNLMDIGLYDKINHREF